MHAVDEKVTPTALRGFHFDLALFDEIKAAFAPPAFRKAGTESFDKAYSADPVFRAWADTNLAAHRAPGYAIVQISLKAHGATPGDATAEQMRVMADLAQIYGHDELRISHEQNVILPHVAKSDLPAIHARLQQQGLATANIGLISDIIACPGMDYCALATARKLPSNTIARLEVVPWSIARTRPREPFTPSPTRRLRDVRFVSLIAGLDIQAKQNASQSKSPPHPRPTAGPQRTRRVFAPTRRGLDLKTRG